MKLHHDKIRGDALINNQLVVFDEEGNGVLDDDEYGEQLLLDGLGFSRVEEKPDKPPFKPPPIPTRKQPAK